MDMSGLHWSILLVTLLLFIHYILQFNGLLLDNNFNLLFKFILLFLKIKTITLSLLFQCQVIIITSIQLFSFLSLPATVSIIAIS